MTTVNLSDEFVNEAKRYAKIESRSVPKQIEYWARIGRAARDNPDLPIDFIEDLLIAKAEMEAGELREFKFSKKTKKKK